MIFFLIYIYVIFLHKHLENPGNDLASPFGVPIPMLRTTVLEDTKDTRCLSVSPGSAADGSVP